MPDEDKPTIIFDGTCKFCTGMVGRFGKVTGDKVVYKPFQTMNPPLQNHLRRDFEHRIQLYKPGGERIQGAQAVLYALSTNRLFAPLLWSYEHIPGMASVAEGVYWAISKHRKHL